MSANPIQACIDTLISPTAAFNTVKDKKGWSWIPFIILTSVTVAILFYYFSAVDFEWLKQQLLDDIAKSKPMTDEELKTSASFFKKDTMMWGGAIGAVIGVIILNLLVAAYYNITTKVAVKSEYKFTDWFAFTWWTSVPGIVSAIVSALVIVFAPDGMVSTQDLNPTSLNGLFFGFDASSAWFSLVEGLTLFSFWSIAIATIGLTVWLKIDNKKAFYIAVAPYAVIYGCWALYILLIA
jgi:hypothetical protein